MRDALISARGSGYTRDFEMRRWLSHVDLDGGTLSAYHGASPMPREVEDALAIIEGHINSLEKLKADEQEVRDFRAANARADAQPASGVRHG